MLAPMTSTDLDKRRYRAAHRAAGEFADCHAADCYASDPDTTAADHAFVAAYMWAMCLFDGVPAGRRDALGRPA